MRTSEKIRAWAFYALVVGSFLFIWLPLMCLPQEITPSARGGHKTLAASAPFEALTVLDRNNNPVTLGRTSIINPASGDGSYTADPTGVTDSTAAIQAALDNAGTATVELPAGTFLIGTAGAPLFLGNHHLRGQGQGVTILKASNTGIQTPISSWTCTAATGTCASGTAPYTLTVNTSKPAFQSLIGTDSYCSPSGGTCQLSTYFGWNAHTDYYGMFGGALNGARSGASLPVLPSTLPFLATTFTIQMAIPPAASSGTGGTFLIPAATIQTYDARSSTQATNYEIDNLTFDGSCNACSTAASGWTSEILHLGARGTYAPPGIVSTGFVHDVTFQNVATSAIYFSNTSGLTFRNITCNNIGLNCFNVQDNSNVNIDTLKVLNIGFPFQGNTGTFQAVGFNSLFALAGYHDIHIAHMVYAPNTNSNIIAFGLQGFQNGASPDTSHLAFRKFTLTDYTFVYTGCSLNKGGPVSIFADDLLIDGIDDDMSACNPASPPVNPVDFLEIGGNNNHITNGKNVQVQWAGIRSDFTHARNIEVDHIVWDTFSPAGSGQNGGVFQISGQQQNGTTPCDIFNVRFHDVDITFNLTAGNNSAFVAGIGYGEGGTTCAIQKVDIHDIHAHKLGVASALAAFRALGVGNGTIGHKDWHFHENSLDGFSNYLTAECANALNPTNKPGTTVTGLRIIHEVSDLASGSWFQNNTTAGGCPANWTNPSSPDITQM